MKTSFNYHPADWRSKYQQNILRFFCVRNVFFNGSYFVMSQGPNKMGPNLAHGPEFQIQLVRSVQSLCGAPENETPSLFPWNHWELVGSGGSGVLIWSDGGFATSVEGLPSSPTPPPLVFSTMLKSFHCSYYINPKRPKLSPVHITQFSPNNRFISLIRFLVSSKHTTSE